MSEAKDVGKVTSDPLCPARRYGVVACRCDILRQARAEVFEKCAKIAEGGKYLMFLTKNAVAFGMADSDRAVKIRVQARKEVATAIRAAAKEGTK